MQRGACPLALLGVSILAGKHVGRLHEIRLQNDRRQTGQGAASDGPLYEDSTKGVPLKAEVSPGAAR